MIATARHRPFRIQPTRWFASPDTLDAAGEALRERLRVLECARDGRAAFARAYAAHIPPVRRAVGAGGPDAASIERLALALVRRYLASLAGWDRGGMSSTPAVWRAAFAIARCDGIAHERVLAASVVAHLSFDAPLAFARLGVGTGDRAACDALLRIEWPGVPSRVVHEAGGRAWADAEALAEAPDDTARSREFTRIEAGVLRVMRSLAAS